MGSTKESYLFNHCGAVPPHTPRGLEDWTFVPRRSILHRPIENLSPDAGKRHFSISTVPPASSTRSSVSSIVSRSMPRTPSSRSGRERAPSPSLLHDGATVTGVDRCANRVATAWSRAQTAAVPGIEFGRSDAANLPSPMSCTRLAPPPHHRQLGRPPMRRCAGERPRDRLPHVQNGASVFPFATRRYPGEPRTSNRNALADASRKQSQNCQWVTTFRTKIIQHVADVCRDSG